MIQVVLKWMVIKIYLHFCRFLLNVLEPFEFRRNDPNLTADGGSKCWDDPIKTEGGEVGLRIVGGKIPKIVIIISFFLNFTKDFLNYFHPNSIEFYTCISTFIPFNFRYVEKKWEQSNLGYQCHKFSWNIVPVQLLKWCIISS